MLFKKVEVQRKPLFVAEQVIRAIKEGFYKPGSKLPPERVLADEMSVSRNSVREALSALQVLDIVESRTGDGTYVKESVTDINIDAQILPLLEESDSPVKIFEAMGVLEIGVVELAIHNAKAQDTKELEKALDRMRARVGERDYEGYGQANLEFHLVIAAASKNPVVERTMASLWKSTSQRLLNEILKGYWQERIESSIQIHEELFDAIRDKDYDAANRVVRTHYEETRGYLLGSVGNQDSGSGAGTASA